MIRGSSYKETFLDVTLLRTVLRLEHRQVGEEKAALVHPGKHCLSHPEAS